MFKQLKVRLYPTIKQQQFLDNHFNAYRYCYNLCLEYKIMMYRDYQINKSGYDMQKELFEIRNENEWLKQCKAESIRRAALDVDETFKKFYKGNGFPKFKSKRGEQSFFDHQPNKIKNNKIKFYKQKIKFKTSDRYIQLLENNHIIKITFKKDLLNNYYATCLIELPDQEKLPINNNLVGLDLGIKDLIITSEGIKYENYKFLINSHHKLIKLQRQFSKTKKGGKNREKLRVKIAKLNLKIRRQKEHYYHQITNQLISENQTIVIETLKIKNMIKNPKLARNISDASWGLIISMLEYKCDWTGRNLIKIDQWYPSSKTCSNCNYVKKELSLTERTYNCEVCNFSIDRDINAAINIRNTGLKIPVVPLESVGYELYDKGSKHLKINQQIINN